MVLGIFCPRRRCGQLFPLASGAFCARTNACRFKTHRQLKAAAWPEIEQLVREMALCPDLLEQQVKATVAMVSTTENQWVCEIERQGDSFNQQEVEFAWYSALRQLGVDVDFVSPEQDLAGYKMVFVRCMPGGSARVC
ncbi:MAG: beta-galactosidase trimerization domain-containing protein [Rheinheimera sp.]|nr:beta-galactosidase trimerization domain-containing protein [Rheinheimera sp.]